MQSTSAFAATRARQLGSRDGDFVFFDAWIASVCVASLAFDFSVVAMLAVLAQFVYTLDTDEVRW